MEEQDKNFERALAQYKKLKPESLPYMAAQVRIAETYFQMDEKEKSIEYLKAMAEKRPDVGLVRRALAQNYFDIKNFAKAAEVYSTLIADIEGPVDHQHASLFFARGAAYERLKDYDKATADLSKALELEPDNPVVLNYLGYMWIDQGKNIEQGYDYIKQAVLLRPNDGAIVDSLGWVYYKRGKFDVAVRYLEKAVSLMPFDATINMHLGDVYHKLGRTNEARVQWRRALDLGPDTEADKQRLIKLMTSN
jgi:tetratricopeptide (TPR) repeat protein